MLGIRYVLIRRDRALGIPVLARERSNESNHCNITVVAGLIAASRQPSRSMQGHGMLASSAVILRWLL